MNLSKINQTAGGAILQHNKKKIMTEELKKKVDRAIKLLQSTCQDQQVELCYSGGKDSDVILELAKMSKINYRAIYKNTTINLQELSNIV